MDINVPRRGAMVHVFFIAGSMGVGWFPVSSALVETMTILAHTGLPPGSRLR